MREEHACAFRPGLASHARVGRLALLAVVFVLPSGCRAPPPANPSLPPIPIACPDPPPAMTPVEAFGALARHARELRANQMVRLEPADPPIFATLHSPGLALLEAALAAPDKAQQLEPAWLQRQLLVNYVEVQSAVDLGDLAEDPARVALSDDGGRRRTALYAMARSDGGHHSYRFYFDPLLVDRERDLTVISFHLPRGEGTAVASWRLTRRSLWGMDALPVIFPMIRLRDLRRARWALLAGRRDQAMEMLEDLVACAPDLDQARGLLQAISAARPRSAGVQQTIRLDGGKLPGAGLGHDPRRDLSLRAALLARLSPLSARGLISQRHLLQANEALRRAISSLSTGDPGWSLPPAVLDFDRAIAALLAEGLDGPGDPPRRGTTADIRPLAIAGGVALSDREVAEELERRILLANYGLVPRWVKGRHGQRDRLFELQPVLTGEGAGWTVVGRPEQRLGWGWIHPGIPARQYAVRFVDRSAAYWRSQVEMARSAAALRSVAKRLLESEMQSGDEEAALLALSGWVQLKADRAVGDLLPLLERQTAPRRAALALIALAPLRDPKVTAALHRAARSPRIEIRAGAMVALGQRQGEEERGLLRQGLSDHEPRVAGAALEGLLRRGDPRASREARRWLSADPVRRRIVLSIAARGQGKLSALAGELARAAGPELADPAAVVGALVRVEEPRSAGALIALYGRYPRHRAAILAAARGAAFTRLFHLALTADEVELRREATFKLAQSTRPAEAPLIKAVGDADGLVRLAAHSGLAKLGRTDSLLALGAGARGTCAERRIVISALCRSMDRASRGRLLLDGLNSRCPALWSGIWELVVQYQPDDLSLQRAGMTSTSREVRVKGALAALGLRTGTVLGIPPWI